MQISVVLQWKGGRSDQHQLPILTGHREIKRDDADTVDLLRRLAAFYPDGEIARILNRQKRVTARGLPYTASRVAALRGRHGIAVCPPSEADASGVYQSITLDSGTSPFVFFLFHSCMAWMAKTA